MSPRHPAFTHAARALAAAAALVLSSATGWSSDVPAAAHFRNAIEPILNDYCYDCHGDGVKKGQVVLDEFPSDAALLGGHDLWLAVLKNLRAGLMPPRREAQPTAAERRRIEEWIKFEAFGIDPRQPDPGRVTLRRLNRIEYRNTIRDLMGIEFASEVEFPPDDTGYGFDNIGDVLTVSPMLLEKYLAAAKAIVTEAVPVVSRVVAETTIEGVRFRPPGGAAETGETRDRRRETARSLNYYEAASVGTTFPVERAGNYRLILNLAVRGNFDFDPGRCRVIFKMDDRAVLDREFGWQDFKAFPFEFEAAWESGEHRLSCEVQPLTPVAQKINSLNLQIVSAIVRGPVEEQHWIRPPNYDRFFAGADPQTLDARRAAARILLRSFATKAFRRPVDDRTVERLAALAESVFTQPGKSYEAGIAHALVAVLASPRFLFRMEESAPGTAADAAFAEVDEYALASRLSYFLWSTMPDDKLIRLASSGELRKNLPAQMQRMLADPRGESLARNFTGQWLQTRDVDGIPINSRVVLARDKGEEREVEHLRQRFRAINSLPENERTPEQVAEMEVMREQFRRRGRKPQVELDGELRNAMQRETELFFAHIIREDRSVTELLNSDYTFLNERLAKLYGIPGVDGPEMRRVALPADSPRGGVLTHGSVLVVTSNPDRTSAVKRGLFVLDNFLGAPAPPPPENVPALEAAEQDIKDHQPTLREALALHREKPLCAGCHNRMDPIGLAFENFNAMGMWRDKERGQPLDTAGQLITGERFQSVRELKGLLAANHRTEFFRCLTEKLLTYAMGRGLEWYDVETVDQIVRRLEAENGKFSALLTGIIESAPFQKQRAAATAGTEPEPALTTQRHTP